MCMCTRISRVKKHMAMSDTWSATKTYPTNGSTKIQNGQFHLWVGLCIKIKMLLLGRCCRIYVQLQLKLESTQTVQTSAKAKVSAGGRLSPGLTLKHRRWHYWINTYDEFLLVLYSNFGCVCYRFCKSVWCRNDLAEWLWPDSEGQSGSSGPRPTFGKNLYVKPCIFFYVRLHTDRQNGRQTDLIA